ncbi:MAG: hypothetical protein NTX75_04265 [Proteobacteria bacterium]|nr:hypothetical protein [Pseudomonadota bacterium]
MSKAVKSFNVEKTIYDSLIKLFKKYEASTSVSFFVEQCLSKLLKNLSEVEEVLKKTDYYPDIMKFIIERSCNEVIVTTAGTRAVPEGLMNRDITTDPYSSIVPLYVNNEDDLQPLKYNPDNWEEDERPEYLEGVYWVEEYEAYKQGLPVVFVRLLKTGKFELSRDKRVLIEKETGKRFIEFYGTQVIQVATNAKVISTNDEK